MEAFSIDPHMNPPELWAKQLETLSEYTSIYIQKVHPLKSLKRFKRQQTQ